MNTKKLIAGAVAAAVLAIGGGTAIAAQQAPQMTKGGEAKQEEQEPSVKSSIQAPAEKGEQDEAAEARQLEGLAKIDQKTAERAALGATPGKVQKAQLGNEDGSVAWEVEVAANDGTDQKVRVDAGNGEVLAQEAEDSEQGEANEANEGPAEANRAPEAGETTR